MTTPIDITPEQELAYFDATAHELRMLLRKMHAMREALTEMEGYVLGRRELKKKGGLTGEFKRVTSREQVMTLLSAPGGLKRKQAEVADRLGVKIRTVAFAFKKLLKEGEIVRGAENTRDFAKYCAAGRWEGFDALTGNDRLDEMVHNELNWRFSSKIWRHGQTPYATGVESFLGCEKGDVTASVLRLAAAGRIQLDGAGKVVRSDLEKALEKEVGV